MLTVTSKDNKIYKFVKSLQEKKARDRFFVVEGTKNIEEAAKAGAAFEMICFSVDQYQRLQENMDFSSMNVGQIVLFTHALFSKLADTVTPQGVLAVLDKNVIRSVTQVKPEDVFMVLENLQDPGNIGTIIRTCNAAGVQSIVTVGDCADIFSPKTVRSTMGGLFSIQLLHFKRSEEALLFFKENNITTYALAPGGTCSIYDVKKWEGVAIFVGNESGGLLPETIKNCDFPVNIPMPGNSESLNASVAASLAVYETVRYRTIKDCI